MTKTLLKNFPTVIAICLIFAVYFMGMEQIDAKVTAFFNEHKLAIIGWPLTLVPMWGIFVWVKRMTWSKGE